MAFSTFVVANDKQNKATVMPSKYTLAVNQSYLESLPFDDKSAFDNARQGLLRGLDYDGVVKDAVGRVVWDANAYAFIKEAKKVPKTVNPSLWRQASLLNISGLFKVSEFIYQVRGLDLSNLTIIETKKGIVVIDPLTTIETANAAIELYYKERGKKPIIAVIYSHSHIDHYGGAGGLMNDDNRKDIQVIAPEGFYQHAISENLLAGTIMAKRASYMYGSLLQKNESGQVSTGLGMITPQGTTSLIEPDTVITHTNQTLTIDGVDFVFYMAPESEAPAEMFFYIPEYKALFTAEDATQTMHNIYTLRGAKIRDPLLWSQYLNEVLHKWAVDAEVLYAPHHWPIWGSENIQHHLVMQRDLYRYINDQTLRLANLGYDMSEIAERVKLPKALSSYWANRGYYGSLSTNVKGAYVHYLGYFSGNPAELNPLPTRQASSKYIEYMGGEKAVVKRAQKDYEENNYRWVIEVLNKVILINPNNQEAKALLIDTYAQLAYQSENGPWRNFYLTESLKLQGKIVENQSRKVTQLSSFADMPLQSLFDYLAVRIMPERADADKRVKLNIIFTDTNEDFAIDYSHATISTLSGTLFDEANVSLKLTRSQFNQLVLYALNDEIKDKARFAQVIKKNKIEVDGNIEDAKVIFDSFEDFPYISNDIAKI